MITTLLTLTFQAAPRHQTTDKKVENTAQEVQTSFVEQKKS